MKFITDVSAETVVTGGMAVALAMNLAAPLIVKRLDPTPTRQSYTVAVIEVVRMEPHHFDVGSLSGGVHWTQEGPVLLPVTEGELDRT